MKTVLETEEGLHMYYLVTVSRNQNRIVIVSCDSSRDVFVLHLSELVNLIFKKT